MKRKSILLSMMLLIALLAQAGIPVGYYTRADGKKKAELKAAMKDIVGKANVLGYGSGEGKTWSGFYQTDRYNGNQVRDRYSYETFYFPNANGGTPSGMNIEHSFPKSWWGGATNQAYKDLFNLMPCEQKINSAKSNFAMGLVTSVKTSNGCTKVGTGPTDKGNKQLWEPADEWKGDFARNYFYMVTVYSDLRWESNGLDMLENNTWPTLQKWAYELMLEWNDQDPVDNIERDRNEAVYKIQGNRNPFIDYPHLADYIWGDSIDYAFSIDGSSTGGNTSVPGGDEEAEEETLEDVDFTQSMPAGWSIDNQELPSPLSTVWTQTSQYGMKATAFYNSTHYAADSWLISPEYDLTQMGSAQITFRHTGKFFGDMKQEATLWIMLDRSAQWTQLPINTYMTGSDWNYVENTTDLSAYCGHDIQVAFRYRSNESYTPTWEIRNFSLTVIPNVTAVDAPEATDIAPTVPVYYDLQGRRVERPVRGLYIVAGKKILVH